MKANYAPNLKNMPLSSIFYALSDPARLDIVHTLLEDSETSCGQCKSTLSKSTMSHHFKVLREAGVIQRREDGKVHYISLRKSELDARMPGLLNMLKKCGGPL